MNTAIRLPQWAQPICSCVVETKPHHKCHHFLSVKQGWDETCGKHKQQKNVSSYSHMSAAKNICSRKKDKLYRYGFVGIHEPKLLSYMANFVNCCETHLAIQISLCTLLSLRALSLFKSKMPPLWRILRTTSLKTFHQATLQWTVQMCYR